MKKLIMALVIVCLVGCEKSTKEISGSFNFPEELKDCKMYSLSNGGSSVIVARCPLSSTTTTYNCGKITCSSMTVEVDTVGFGEYERLKKKFNK